MSLIDTILSRIVANNFPAPENEEHNLLLAGRIEAYEDVLTMLGFYNENHEPRFRS